MRQQIEPRGVVGVKDHFVAIHRVGNANRFNDAAFGQDRRSIFPTEVFLDPTAKLGHLVENALRQVDTNETAQKSLSERRDKFRVSVGKTRLQLVLRVAHIGLRCAVLLGIDQVDGRPRGLCCIHRIFPAPGGLSEEDKTYANRS